MVILLVLMKISRSMQFLLFGICVWSIHGNYGKEKCAAINKEKTVSVLGDTDGLNIMLGFREKQRAGCQDCYFRYHQGWI